MLCRFSSLLLELSLESIDDLDSLLLQLLARTTDFHEPLIETHDEVVS